MNPAFTLGYALLWTLTIVQGLVLLGLVRARRSAAARPAEPSADRAAPAPSSSRVGTPAPAFPATVLSTGAEADPRALSGTPLLLALVAGGCSTCARALPALRHLADDENRRLVLVCVGPPEASRAYADEAGPGALVLSDPAGRSVRAYGVSSIPHVVAIGADSRVTAEGGALDDDGTWRFASTAAPAGAGA